VCDVNNDVVYTRGEKSNFPPQKKEYNNPEGNSLWVLLRKRNRSSAFFKKRKNTLIFSSVDPNG
jgi:hypothetical protein